MPNNNTRRKYPLIFCVAGVVGCLVFLKTHILVVSLVISLTVAAVVFFYPEIIKKVKEAQGEEKFNMAQEAKKLFVYWIYFFVPTAIVLAIADKGYYIVPDVVVYAMILAIIWRALFPIVNAKYKKYGRLGYLAFILASWGAGFGIVVCFGYLLLFR